MWTKSFVRKRFSVREDEPMRRASVWGVAAGVVLIAAGSLLGWQDPGIAQRSNTSVAQRPFAEPPSTKLPSAGEGLLAFGVVSPDGKYQQIAVIDAEKRALAVYHVRLEDGRTELKSVRNIKWDLELEDFEGMGLLPRDIKALLDRR
jgi:hypothetical protein